MNHFPFSTTEEDHFKVIEKYFTERGPVYHQFESYEYLVHNMMQRIVDECNSIEISTKSGGTTTPLKINLYKATFGQIYFEKASVTDENRVLLYLTPNEARLRDITYDSPVFVDIKEEFWEGDVKVNQINHPKVFLMRMPTMVGSSKCNLYGKTIQECIELGECENDPKGYFIVNGKERALICQERLCHSHVYVFENNSEKIVAEMRSMSEETGHSILIKAIIDKDFRNCYFSLPYMSKEVLAGAVFKALGFSNEEIVHLIQPSTVEEFKMVKRLVRDSIIFQTPKDAILYISKSSIQKVEDSDEHRIHYTTQVIENELFPHMGISTKLEKGIFLGTMINKLFRVCTGARTFDDRDNVSIKRIEGPGMLLGDLFRMCLKRYCDNLKKYLEKRQDIITAISRTNSITQAIRGPMCFVKGTLVSLSNGTSVPIEKLETLGANVLGWNKETCLLEPSIQTHFFNQGKRNTIVLTFEDGRTIQCTPDHKLLVFQNEKPTWLEASTIPNGSRLISGPDYTEDIIDEDEKDWILEINNEIFSMDTFQNRQKALALSRIIGLVMSDGCLKKKRGGSVYIGNLHDVNNFIEDYKKITGNIPTYTDDSDDIYGRIYTVHLLNDITKILRKIEGIIIGDSMLQSSLPDFILKSTCPKSIVREFLGGLFGGDGHCPLLDKRDGKRTGFQGVAFSWSIDEKYIDKLQKTFNNLLVLIEKIGITGSYLNGPYRSKDKENRPFIRLHVPSSTQFNKLIGFRYCIYKSYKLTIINSYLRMQENIKKQHNFTVERTNELKELYKNKNLKECLKIAQDELRNKEYIMNDYYSLSSYEDMHKRRDKNRSVNLKNLQEKYGVISIEKFIEDLGVSSWFEKKYVNERDMTAIPFFTMKLVDIRRGESETVYDITVENTHSFLANGIVSSNCTGNWAAQKNTYVRTGVSQIMSRLTYPATVSHLRRIVIPIGKEGKNVKVRQIHPTQSFFIDVIESPEGKGIGIIKNFALLAKLTVGCNPILVRRFLEESEYIESTNEYLKMAKPNLVLLNGVLIGLTRDIDECYKELRRIKFTEHIFSDQVSFIMDKEEHEIRIFCDAGRFMRPVINVVEETDEKSDTRLTISLRKEHLSKSWLDLLEDDVIRYVDSNEVENSLIAMYPSDIVEHSTQPYNYCEIHPSTMLGVCSSVIPYGEHNQCPRLVYEASMMKQALGVYALSYKNRFDTISHVMAYPQKALVDTKYNKMLHYDEMLTGLNPIVAIMCYTGFNQEDSVILNKGSVDRGMFVTTAYRTLSCEEKKKTNCSFEKIEIPPLSCQSKALNYSKLGKDGIVHKGVPVYKGDVIIGKTLTKVQKEEQEEKIDCSLSISSGEEGIIDEIWRGKTEEGYIMIKVKIRQLRIPEVGDKMACFTDNTSVLTTNGWKSIKDVSVNDSVATLKNDEIVYEKPSSVFEYDYEGKMYNLVSQQLDMTVTPNHKLYVKKRNHTEFGLYRADNIFGKRVSHKKNGEWKAENKEVFTLGSYNDFSEVSYSVKDWCYFLGIWYAEGWATLKSKTTGVVSISVNKKRVLTKLTEVLQNMNIIFTYNEREQKIHIYNQQLFQHFKPQSVGAPHKTLPEYVWDFSKEECRYLLEGMLLGDGSKSTNSKSWSYWTSSKKLAEDVQRLALHCGWSANMILPEGRKAGNTMTMLDGRIVTSNFYNYRVAIITSKNEPTVNHTQKIQKEEWIDYKGKVYCIEVPSHVFYVKQNGKPYWSGNSRSSQKGVCGLLLEQENMPFTQQGITPDLLMNAHSIPSRMTMSQMLECMYSKACALGGTFGDSTAFTDQSIDPVEDISKKLQAFGFQKYGNERLYSGFTGEMLDAEIFIGPTYYQRLKHLVADKIHCLTTDHEVLTRNGWKPIGDVTVDDKVATLDKNGYLVYQEPFSVFNYPDYEGNMYYIKTESVDLTVTENHRMWVKDYESDSFIFQYAYQLFDKDVYYKNNAKWNVSDKNLITEDMIIELVFELKTNKTYYIPEWMFMIDSGFVRIFFDILDNGISKVTTTSKDLINQLQQLILHTGGWSGSTILSDLHYILLIDKTQKDPFVYHCAQYVKNQKCHVVCLSVPNEIFYVRRNGKAVWTGNSRATGNVTMMHHQPSEGRSREGGLRVGEMERDALISHGGAAFIQETLFDMSDQYQINVCETCGNIVSSATACRMCKTGQINRTNIPYCAKLLFQELEAMGINIQINTKEEQK